MTEYVSLADYLILVQETLDVDALGAIKMTDLDLADSALHAPMAAFGGEEMYPVFHDKAAVLLVRLAKNHPLPDGNKRAAWASLRLFILRNGWRWISMPTVDEVEEMVVGAITNERDENAWLIGSTTSSNQSKCSKPCGSMGDGTTATPRRSAARRTGDEKTAPTRSPP